MVGHRATPARSASTSSRRSHSITRQGASTPTSTSSAPRATTARSASASSRRSRSITRLEASTPRASSVSRPSRSITRRGVSTPTSTRSTLCATQTRSAQSASSRRPRSITRREASTPCATPARPVSALKRKGVKSIATLANNNKSYWVYIISNMYLVHTNLAVARFNVPLSLTSGSLGRLA